MNKRRTFFLFFFLIIIYSNTSFATNSDGIKDTIINDTIISPSFNEDYLMSDDPIVTMFDSLTKISFTDSVIPNNTMPTYDPNIYSSYDALDSLYAKRLNILNVNSPFKYEYNDDVRRYIDIYVSKKRSLTARMLGLSKIYFPVFEEQLDKYNLPLELKYLAIVESALIPTAKSRAGAAGLWQFMLGTGRMYNLSVSSYVDDRYDPLKSTIAACEHFQDLYAQFHDWALVLAAYNSGAGNVNKAIKRSGGEMDFWKIKPYLPHETQGYVPAFIAVSYVMNYASEHNIYPIEPNMVHLKTDTVMIHKELTFAQLSEYLNVPMEDLILLNPCYKAGVIPAYENKSYALRLPLEYVDNFVTHDSAIYNYKSKNEQLNQEWLVIQKKEMEKFKKTLNKGKYTTGYHTVKKGETLGSIAGIYNCTIKEIKDWNNIQGTTINVGQKLYVYSDKKVKNLSSNNNTTVNKKVTDINKTVVNKPISENKKTTLSKKFIYYTVQKGDTLWSIASKYPGVSVDDIKKANNLNDAKLQPGQKLKITISS
jgi:membrane-bound lytic murein transglycosylase D